MGFVIMKGKYDVDEFRRILKMVEDNCIWQAFNAYQEYFECYPNDISAKSYYVDLLIKVGRFDEAEELIEEHIHKSNLSKISREDFEFRKLRLLSSTGQYQECYDLLLRDFDILKQRGWLIQGVLLELKKKLGILESSDYKQNHYFLSQIVNYSEDLCLKNLDKYRYHGDDAASIYFMDDFPIEKVYYMLRDMLPFGKKIYLDLTTNLYIFKYDNNGKINGKMVDYLAVTTLLDSNDIIRIRPYENQGRLACENLYLPTVTEESSKIKKISQIDKFNRRYFQK